MKEKEKIANEMSKQIKIFNNQEFGQVRLAIINEKPYAVGIDIAKALQYSNPSKAIVNHCKGITKLGIPSTGGIQQTNMIPEGDIYRLIVKAADQSKNTEIKKKAEKFESWIFDEILPSIRKTGGYLGTDKDMTDEEIMAKALMVAQNTINKKNELLQAKEKELADTKEDLNTKNKFINQIAVSENSLLVREVAKIASKENIAIGEKRLWSKLREWGLIFKNSTEPKQKYIDNGYFEVVEGSKSSKGSTFTYHTTRVTGKGQVYIINRLLKEQ